MNAGSIELGALAIAALALGCERLSVDPPPPPSRHEIAAAPPAALGAHVASHAAPSPVEQAAPNQEAPEPDPEGGEAVPGPDAGSGPFPGHAPEPEGVAL
jgi:hypothetical protein